jgi:hypothetical protein
LSASLSSRRTGDQKRDGVRHGPGYTGRRLAYPVVMVNAPFVWNYNRSVGAAIRRFATRAMIDAS